MRGIHYTKQLISTVRKHTITQKNELEALCQGLQSTVHTDKTGNKTDTKHYVKQLTERSQFTVIPNANATNLCQSTARGFKYKKVSKGARYRPVVMWVYLPSDDRHSIAVPRHIGGCLSPSRDVDANKPTGC